MKGKDLLEDLQRMTPEQLEYPIEICFKVQIVDNPEHPEDSFQLHADDPVCGIAISDSEKSILILGSEVAEEFKRVFPNDQTEGNTDEKAS